MNEIAFSIITCTHNPSQDVFNQLIHSILVIQESTQEPFEWIIVDNNSLPSIGSGKSYSHLLNEIHTLKVINEKKKGLTAARIAGVKNARFEYIIFFDDDNEPVPDYLQNAAKLISKYPEVACWGAGKIQVNYLDENHDPWLDQKKAIFQERSIEETLTFNEPKWGKAYPQGTGMVCRKDVLINYVQKVQKGVFSLTDRKGRSLSSGGDVQIVLSAIQMGYKVGTSGLLKLKHNIDKNKANFAYLFRLTYGMASSAVQAYNQVMEQNKVPFKRHTNGDVWRVLWYHLRFFKFKFLKKEALLRLAQQLGDINAIYLAYPNKKKPKLLKRVTNWLFHE